MIFQPLDVVLAGIQVGLSTDPRRAIVFAIQPGTILVFACSSQLDLYDPCNDFLIESDDPNFGPTGFKKTSYAIGGKIHRLPHNRVLKKYGMLEGDLAARYLEWAG